MMRNTRKKKLYISLIIYLSILVHASIACAGSVTLAWDQPMTNADGTPVTDLQGYKIYYRTASNNLINSITVGDVNTYKVTDLTVGETYFFVVTAYDFSGNESGYSTLASVTITNSPPTEPVLESPKNGGKYNGKKVGFRWRKSKDPDGNTVTYDVTLCQDAGLTTGCTTKTNVASITKSDVYYADIGNLGTGLLFFGIMIIPRFNRKSSRRIPLSHAAVAVVCLLFLISCGGGSDSAFTLSNGDAPGGVIQTELDVSSGTTYYWQVVAKDGNGGETYSPVWSFDTQ